MACNEGGTVGMMTAVWAVENTLPAPRVGTVPLEGIGFSHGENMQQLPRIGQRKFPRYHLLLQRPPVVGDDITILPHFVHHF